ncbi:MAG: ABC transporter ATP-binding protein [Rhodospirillaceae bacterium]|nr:ABC transporter ATP-binding protein [Rhodospirillaceae bacterium]MDD9918076.1 ABC transporter ATP-binding protein [Rhodospirillaceae bacterium]MDD9926677.1 ABC transporter ATP-binding protein [Rhodospirillaceae bacterium]
MSDNSAVNGKAPRRRNMPLREIFAVSRRLGFRTRWAVGILLLNLGAILFEGIGIGIFLPILEFMNNAGEVQTLAEESRMWREILNVFGALGIPLSLGTLLVLAFCAVLIRQAFTYWRLVYLARTQAQFVWIVRNLAFRRFIGATMVYHDGVRAGDFVNEVSIELERASSCITSMITYVGYLLLCALYAIVLFAMSPSMTAIAVAVIVAAVACLYVLLQRTRSVGVALTDANQQVSRFLIERLKSVRFVRLSGTQDAESEAMSSITGEQRRQNVALLRLKAIVSVLIEPMVVGVAFGILYLAVHNFGLGLEQILIFFLIGMRLLPVVKESTLIRQGILGSMASLEILQKRLETLEAAQDQDDGRLKFDRLKDGIRFTHVSYNYYGADVSIPALRDVNLFMPAGKMTALVGPSGAGKSTLVDLLPRLRDIDGGEILIDGEALSAFKKSALRAGIAYAPQEPQLFNVTAREHILYGKNDATDQEIVEAARLARADGFLSALPDGYGAMLGENGDRLSGGQRQRLDLARALISRAPLLILDEPTSNLDAESEFEFRKALDGIRARGDITIVLIGHRLSTVASADNIAVLQEGVVTESGTHEELLRRGGWYAEAFEKQSGQTLHAVESAG